MIIVTVGPSCNNPKTIAGMKSAGASCFRINLSHSDKKDISFYWDMLAKENIVPSIDKQGAQVIFLMKKKEKNFIFVENI